MAAKTVDRHFRVFDIEHQGRLTGRPIQEGIGVVDIQFGLEQRGQNILQLTLAGDFDHHDGGFRERKPMLLKKAPRQIGIIDDDS